MNEDQANTETLSVEEIETEWWEPLGCKCEVDFEDE